MPFHDEVRDRFWQIIVGFLITVPLAMITSSEDKLIVIIMYVLIVLITFQVYFILRYFLHCRKTIKIF